MPFTFLFIFDCNSGSQDFARISKKGSEGCSPHSPIPRCRVCSFPTSPITNPPEKFMHNVDRGTTCREVRLRVGSRIFICESYSLFLDPPPHFWGALLTPPKKSKTPHPLRAMAMPLLRNQKFAKQH